MALLSLRNIRIAFGGPMILNDLTFNIQKGQRICILGRNGTGKSTLLKILGGQMKPDSGEVVSTPGMHIAYLPQDVPDDLAGTSFAVVASGLGQIGDKLAEYYQHLAAGDEEKHHALQHDISLHDGWTLEPMINKALSQVGIAPESLFASLSGGMRRRVLLARALVQNPDILLLDEPTNHLDLESIAWLENFLLSAKPTLVFVTHDRRLLKKIATRIIELDRGQVIDWSCDYGTFLERKQAVLDNELKEWAQFDKVLAQEEVWIRQGIRARRTRNEGRVRELLKMREERKNRRTRLGQVSMTISLADRSGDKVLEARNVSFAYGAQLIVKDFSFLLARGDRIGIIGPNGCGKTTLLNLLLGNLAPQSGQIELGSQVSPLYFDQLRAGIDPNKTVWENVAPAGMDTVNVNGQTRHVISYLQDFLFTSERARTPVRQLSGGEKHRLLLARLFTQPANLLVFDEPTNDLDTETLELLEELLLNYPGTLIVVSHDREFLNNVVTAALVFGKNGAVHEFVGGYDDWERQLAALAEPPKLEEKNRKGKMPAMAAPQAARKLTFKEKNELAGLPGTIEALETEQTELLLQLADFTLCQQPGFVAKVKNRLADIEAALEKSFARWQELDSIPKA